MKMAKQYRNYEKYLRNLDRTEKYIKHVMAKIKKYAVKPLNASIIDTILEENNELTGRTRIFILRSVRGFMDWLVQRGKLKSNPLARLPRLRTAPTRKNRALLREEGEKLLLVSPPERSLIYKVALSTGLRRGEISRLRWAHLDIGERVFRIPAKLTKNRQAATVPFSRSLRDDLAVLALARDSDDPNNKIFPVMPTVRHFNKDVWRAGMRKVDQFGGRVTFHSLRSTFCTLLLKNDRTDSGMVSKLMRHSDPRLTLKVYYSVREAEKREAIDAAMEW